MKFRNQPLYRGEFYVALTIPATEDRDVIPCGAVKLHPSPQSAFRLVFNILYALGDINFAQDNPQCKDGIHTPCIVHRTGGPSAAVYNTCGVCGEQIVICEDSWVALKDTILCKRCDGEGDIPSQRDSLERVSCPVCDGQPHIDYGMVAEYARQIEYYVAQCAKANSALLQIARLATGWKAGNEGAHLLNIYKLAAREVISEPKEQRHDRI